MTESGDLDTPIFKPVVQTASYIHFILRGRNIASVSCLVVESVCLRGIVNEVVATAIVQQVFLA